MHGDRTKHLRAEQSKAVLVFLNLQERDVRPDDVVDVAAHHRKSQYDHEERTLEVIHLTLLSQLQLATIRLKSTQDCKGKYVGIQP